MSTYHWYIKWVLDNDSWRSIFNDYNHERLAEEHFQWLEELGDLIKEKFEVLQPEHTNSTSVTNNKDQGESYHELNLKQLDSIVHNTLLIFQGFEVERREEGSNIFYTVFANLKSGKLLLGKYRVWEWHDGGGRSGWMPSDNSDPKVIKLRDTVWQTIMSTAAEAAKSKATSTVQSANADKLKGGRPRKADDDWAYEQVRIQGRDKQVVFNEWLERIGDRGTLLSNPKDSFNKAVSLKRRKRK